MKKNSLDNVGIGISSPCEEMHINKITNLAYQILRQAQLDDIKTAVIKFLKDNPNPKDSDLHKWAERKKYNIHDVETQIYTLATKFVNFLVDGRANEKGITEKDVDPKELAMGIEVEKEHSPDEDVTKRISMDHLAELSDYYTRLKKMEGEK